MEEYELLEEEDYIIIISEKKEEEEEEERPETPPVYPTFKEEPKKKWYSWLIPILIRWYSWFKRLLQWVAQCSTYKYKKQ